MNEHTNGEAAPAPQPAGQPTGVSALPPGYQSLTPLLSERHADLGFRRRRDYKFAAKLHAVPLTADEFARAQQHIPIVFTKTDPILPVGLLGVETEKNDFVDADGGWREGAYVPAYVRRYPFALVRESEATERMLLCADLKADNFQTEAEGAEEALFKEGKGTDFANTVLDFCRRYEESLAKTRGTCRHLASLDLFEDANVTVKRPNGKTVRIDGFRVVSEERMRKLEDGPLADMARRGVVGLIAAHHFSISQFSGLLHETI